MAPKTKELLEAKSISGTQGTAGRQEKSTAEQGADLFQCPGKFERSFRHILRAEVRNTWGHGHGGVVQKQGTPKLK
jgi:hypothetical protein